MEVSGTSSIDMESRRGFRQSMAWKFGESNKRLIRFANYNCLKNDIDFMSNDNSSISYIKILDTDTYTRSIEMHRIKCALVESRNKSKFLTKTILTFFQILTRKMGY